MKNLPPLSDACTDVATGVVVTACTSASLIHMANDPALSTVAALYTIAATGYLCFKAVILHRVWSRQ